MQFNFYWWFLVDSNTCYLLTNGNHGNLSSVHTTTPHNYARNLDQLGTGTWYETRNSIYLLPLITTEYTKNETLCERGLF